MEVRPREWRESNIFDCVLMDMHMPKVDGIEGAKLIRAKLQFGVFAHYSAFSGCDGGRQEKRLEAGMNDHVSKPIEPDDLADSLLSLDFAKVRYGYDSWTSIRVKI